MSSSGGNRTINHKMLIFLGIAGLFIIALLIMLSSDRAVNSGDIYPEAVNIEEFVPGIMVDLVYSTSDNVYGQPIYEINKAYLRTETAEKLKNAQEELSERGMTIKVWDAYRPPEAQFKLWEIMPDRRFVVDPNSGFSYHSRGVAVDVTLVDENGSELLMPSGFDEFSALADRDYSDVSEVQADNAKLLEEIMLNNGFQSIYYEWWHFTDTNRDNYPLLESDKLKLN